MFAKNAIKVLLELSKVGRSSLRDLAKKTGLSYYQVYRAVRDLEKKGLIAKSSERREFSVNRFLGDLLVELGEKYDLHVLLSKGGFKVVATLLEKPKTAKEISRETGLSYKHTLRVLKDLTLSMAVKYERGFYVLVDDPKLKLFLEWLTGRKGRIIAGRILRKVPLGARVEGSLTGFSVFSQWGVSVQRAFDYYVNPPMKVGLEESIIHALVLAETPQERSLVAIFYAKNVDKIDHSRLLEVAREYGVLEDLLELEAFVRGLRIERPDRYLPWEEVKEQAEIYGVDLEKLRFRPVTEKFFEEIGRVLEREVRVYLFGGACMVLRGLKDGTKDIDIVVPTREEYDALIEALKKLGYRSRVEFEVKRRVGADRPVAVFEKEDSPNVDLYTRVIAGKLMLSRTMLRRAEIRRYGNLILYLASNEDVVLLKLVSNRTRDLLDIELAVKKLRTRLNWNTVLEELAIQERLVNRHFCFLVLQTIQALEERLRIKIPIKSKLERVVEIHLTEIMEEKEKKEGKRSYRKLL